MKGFSLFVLGVCLGVFGAMVRDEAVAADKRAREESMREFLAQFWEKARRDIGVADDSNLNAEVSNVLLRAREGAARDAGIFPQ